MKRSVLALSLFLAVPAAQAAEKKHTQAHGHTATEAKTAAVQGEVVDMACFFGHAGHGEAHKPCAQMCIKAGGPMGVLTKDGQVYLLLESHSAKKSYEALRAQAAQQVKVTGDLKSQGGVQAILVASGEAVK